jgi:hypothetical protein
MAFSHRCKPLVGKVSLTIPGIANLVGVRFTDFPSPGLIVGIPPL